MRRFRIPHSFAAAAVLIAMAAHAAAATVHIVFPYSAGGSGDAVARLLADRLQAATGDDVVVENRTGGAGIIGVTAVKTAPPDGTAILMTPIAPVAVFPFTYRDLSYDPFKDFEPVSQVVEFDYGIAVDPTIPAKTVPDLVAWLKAHPDRATFGSPGTGALPQFTGILFGRLTGIALTHVPYKGSAPALSDVMGGHIALAILPASDMIALKKAGKINVIATSGVRRSSLLPDVPTLKESGLDIVGNGWYAIYVPAGTPKPIIDRLSKVVIETVRSPDIHARLTGLGFEPTGTTPAELAAIQKADAEKWGAVVRAAGFVAD